MSCSDRKLTVHRLVVSKMAEVSQKLIGSRVYRLTVLKTNQNLPSCTDGDSRCLLIHCSQSLAKRESVQNQKATQRGSRKLYRLRTADYQQKDETLFVSSSLYLPSYSWVWCADTRERLEPCKTATDTSSGLFQEKLLACRMSSWTKCAVFIHPDAFRSLQQARAFSTVLLILAENGSEGPNLGHLNLHPRALRGSTSTRGYSWRSKEAHLLHRSKTAYYDILRVSPSATQSQIKTAYYKQSFIYHPDKNPESKEAIHRFSEISEAYTVLGNISLRRKYDRGILSQSDIQSAGRPPSKETTTRTTGSQQQQQQQQRARQFSHTGGKPVFDFDAFYQAHYGEQLQRERFMRARKKKVEEMQKDKLRSWRQQKKIELAVTMLVVAAGLVFVSVIKP